MMPTVPETIVLNQIFLSIRCAIDECLDILSERYRIEQYTIRIAFGRKTVVLQTISDMLSKA